ncbi:MAG: nitroreductase family protein [Thermoprotei archaeon]
MCITVLELARRRRSIRVYKEEPVALEDVLYAIETAIEAPSGANRQPWRFILVTDNTLKAKIRAVCEKYEKKLHSSEGLPSWFREWLAERRITWRKEFLTSAPYLLLVLADTRQPYWRESTWLAVGYLLLALEEKGLASLTYTPPNPRAIAELLGIPRHFSLETIIPIGKPGEYKEKELRMKLERVLCYNTFCFQTNG